MSFELIKEEADFLVKLARAAIINFLRTGKKIAPPLSVPNKLSKKNGVFVTLNNFKKGAEKLRGCIGYPDPIMPLTQAVVESAVKAAIEDPRFPTVSEKELKNIVIEVSVLTTPQLIEVDNPKEYPKKIMVGRDGLIIERGAFKGLLLPQVPLEWKWDEEEYLTNCCLKAGLQPDAWLIKGTKVYRFSSMIARELTPEGDIEVIDMVKALAKPWIVRNRSP